MMKNFSQAVIAGVERLTAWADLLDRINVFPVADGDTGRNLVISLAPLRLFNQKRKSATDNLLLSARGNSGNIASAFFQYFIRATSLKNIPDAIQRGCEKAWQSVPNPKPGTMLSFFDSLAAAVPNFSVFSNDTGIIDVLSQLEAAVHDTTSQHPRLQNAGVVDAGALGMFLYFEGFLHAVAGNKMPFHPITDTFRDRLEVLPSSDTYLERGYCVDTVLRTPIVEAETGQILENLGDSIIVKRQDDCLKIHFHTLDRESARQRLAGIGCVIDWAEDDLFLQTSTFGKTGREPAIHIMTDAAGSLTRHEAKNLKISLLDSYITIGERCFPETCFDPGEVYEAMRSGRKISTSQASIFERHQIYESILSRHKNALYLCVGSAFTGNYQTVMDWKRQNDPDNCLLVMDSEAASGKLGLSALAIASYNLETRHAEKVLNFARQAVYRCEEFLFLDSLEYLAAGGRLSKIGAFFGDMLNMKPVVSPMADGARKVGITRNREEQLRFALEAMGSSLHSDEKAFIMLEYSDNRPWVEEIKIHMEKCYPKAKIIVHPLSLTTGSHTGPGTWAVAFLPAIEIL